MDINNIMERVLSRYPLFGNIIVNLNMKYTEENVSAPAFTDGKNIYYKKELFTDFNEEEREFIISHEILHIVFNHLFRNAGKDEDLLNYVEDAIINQLLIRDGLTMPEGVVDIPDALDYSTEELYLKYLPQLKSIKEWMKENTYHLDLSKISLEGIENKELQELMEENRQKLQQTLQDYQAELEMKAYEARKKSLSAGKKALGSELPAMALGTSKPFLRWQDLLKSSMKQPDDESISFYEVEMDGIIRKVTKEEERQKESEIIVDSSGSMDINKIKAVLRECKNILNTSHIKVGFCDTEFYGWNDIRTSDDIDKLHIIGRGGTDFYTMSRSFSSEVDNKIVITDGYDTFPEDCPDVLWVVIGFELPSHLNPNDDKGSKSLLMIQKADLSKINFIFIDESEITVPQNGKSLLLKPSKKKDL